VKDLVDHALYRRLHHLAIHIVRRVPAMLADARRSARRRMLRSTPRDKPSIDWNGAGPLALRCLRVEHAVAHRIAVQLVQAGQHQHAAFVNSLVCR